MSIRLIGQVVTAKGNVHTVDDWGLNDEYWAMPANAYRRSQPAELAIHFDHDRSWRIGTLDHQQGYLERSKNSGLMAVATLDREDLADLLVDGPWYISDSVWSRRAGQFERSGGILRELSLVHQTGNMATRPVRWSLTDGAPADLPLYWRDTWKRANDAMSGARYRMAPEHLTIHDVDPLGIAEELLTDPAAARQRLAERPTPKVRASTKPPAPTPIAPRPLDRTPVLAPPSLTLWDLQDAGAA